MPRFTWLTPPAPAAIAVVRVDVARALLRRWPEPGRAGFAQLRDRAGTVVDECVVLRLCEDRADLCVHGGPGMRAAVTACLAGHGLLAADEPQDDPRWRALAAAPSPAALAWLLAHPDAAPPFRRDFLTRPPLVLITGPANAGKSTLLNAWCGHRRALVSDLPGTTRDLVAAEALIAGWRVRLLDSAGLRPSDDALERAGQDLAERARTAADLVLVLAPADRPDGGWARPGDLVVQGKADLASDPGPLPWSDRGLRGTAPAGLLAGLGAAVLARLGLPAMAG
jgi:tRNA U34 5-carboxymethylaminomethyl modifying GTPase MnmE/TrmE